MSNIPQRAPHTNALLELLATTSHPVGRGEKPADGGWQGAGESAPFVAYLVLHPIPGGNLDGPLGAPDDDMTGVWQVTAVGAIPEQAEWAADQARDALLTTVPDVDGRAVTRIQVDVLSGVFRDTTVEPSVWISTDRYRIQSTPEPSGS